LPIRISVILNLVPQYRVNSFSFTSIDNERQTTANPLVIAPAFTSAFKELEPIPLFKATAKLGEFLEAQFSQSF
jgi:hypothetical protein